MKYSLVIPCYNEAKNLPLLVERCTKLIQASEDVEVVLVDNGSSDQTQQVLSELLEPEGRIRQLHLVENAGYGGGILGGLNVAEGDIIGWTHADMQTDPIDLLEAIKLFESHGDDLFVKGRRYGRPLSDVIFTVGMSIFELLLMRTRLWDINAQPTMFPKAFFKNWEGRPPTDFSLDLFAYYLAKQSNLKVMRFPVKFGERMHGESSWNVDWVSKKKFIKRTLDFSFELRQRVKK